MYSVALTNTLSSFLEHQLHIAPPPRAILSLVLILYFRRTRQSARGGQEIAQEIIDAFGMAVAKGIFMRVGYMQGVRDAELIQKRFPSQDLTHALAAGPRVHTLEGIGRQPYDALVTPDGRHYIAGLFGEDGLAMVDLWEPQPKVRRILAGYGRGQQPLPVYCYPNGDHDARVRARLAAHRYPFALSTRAGICQGHDDPLALPRIGVSQRNASRPSLLAWRISRGGRS